MKKVLILVNGLYIGGFSKSLINLLYCINENPTDIQFSILNLSNENNELEQDIPTNIEIFHLPQQVYKVSSLNKIRQLRKKIKYVTKEYLYRCFKRELIPQKDVLEYAQAKQSILSDSIQCDFSNYSCFDVVVSWEENYCNYILANHFCNTKRIGYIHPNYIEAGLSKHIDKHYLKRLDRIVAISNKCSEALKQSFPTLVAKVRYIPNTLNSGYYKSLAEKYNADWKCNALIKMVTVSRVDDVSKAVYRMVRICERLKKNIGSFVWYFIGDGPDYAQLKRKIKEIHLGNHLICLGAMTNPYPYMKTADIYVQQSYYEGRPVSVDEAMLLGTPALITNYSSAHEQVDDSVDGWIVENDEDKIYEKLKYLLDHPEEVELVRDNLKHKDFSAFEDCTPFINMINELTNE